MNRKKMLFASMMCANYNYLADDIKALDEAGIDSFHCDVMDGTFVPNMTMGIMDIKTIRSNTKKMVDVHLMIENPSSKIDLFIDAGADLIYIHPEAERYVVKTLAAIKSRGVLAGIAINPDTSLETIYEMLNLVDYVMVMTVNPGFAGQKFIDFTTEKIKKLIKLKEELGFKIIIDGAMSPEKIKEMHELGCDGYVLGTSALFGKNESYAELIDKLREY
jgi:ribulose-phosphate 3-epimerase